MCAIWCILGTSGHQKWDGKQTLCPTFKSGMEFTVPAVPYSFRGPCASTVHGHGLWTYGEEISPEAWLEDKKRRRRNDVRGWTVPDASSGNQKGSVPNMIVECGRRWVMKTRQNGVADKPQCPSLDKSSSTRYNGALLEY